MDDTELQTCIYDYVPHECNHWRDDEEYHARKGTPPCVARPDDDEARHG